MKAKIAGIGYYVPERVVTNKELEGIMDTTDAWIQERTGIQERRYGVPHVETTTTMGARAAEKAMSDAGITGADVDFIIFATLSPDYYFPGCSVLMQRELKITNCEAGALDIRNQCSGFIYGLSIADQFIKSGQYKNILLVGAEMHSMGLDFTTRGRNVSVIFGDGAGAVILQPTEDENHSLINTVLHADGSYAEELAFINPGSHGGHHSPETDFGYEKKEYGGVFFTQKMWDEQWVFPTMNGQVVFKTAVQKFPEVILEGLQKAGLQTSDIQMLIPHQANLRISQFIQRKLSLPDEKVWNNIQKYGNTTAASIPIAMAEAYEAGKLNKGDLICMAAFGSGFTWGSALMRWAK
ncbi:MAG: ketoacyl-ACP synthase III [Saprospiraceae bacterium]|nr:ketoacyl-ACP synthase III [Saprospiraceae bacterium]